MDKTRISRFWRPGLVVILVCLLVATVIAVIFTVPHRGLVSEDGKVCFYNEDGTLFTGGLLEIIDRGNTDYYYFQNDGTAFTGGYKAIDKDGQRAYYYFQQDGTAFTGGYKNFAIDGRQYHYYFQEDGTAFTGGYREVSIDGNKYAFYFLPNGQAFTNGYKTANVQGATYYYYFGEDGKAFTGGFKEISFGEESHRYFFQGDGKAAPAGLATIDGKQYYFQADGRAVQNTFVNIADNRYYFGEDCTAVTDRWFCVGDGYYYANGNGVLSTDTVVEGYILDEKGKSATKYRVNELLEQFTEESMTVQEKLDAIYNWVLTNGMRYRRNYDHLKADWEWKDSWLDERAVMLLDNWGGNCFAYAALTGFMIREATGLPTAVYHGWTPGPSGSLIPHGWAAVCQEDVWYVYDPELYKFGEYSVSSCYKEPAEGSIIHVQGVGYDLY